MGACASVDDDAKEFRVRPESPVDADSFFQDRSELSATQLMWVSVIEDHDDFIHEEGQIPSSIRAAAPEVVRQRCIEDPSQWKRFMYQELSRSLRALDEAFEQCTQVAPRKVVGKNGSAPNTDAMAHHGSAQLQDPQWNDAFSGAAVSYLSELLYVSSEVHVLFFFFKLLLRGRRPGDLAELSPSKLKQEGPAMDEWCVTRRSWIEGWISLKCFSLAEARQTARILAQEFDAFTLEDTSFKAFHRFVFRFLSKDHSLQQEAVARDDALKWLHLELEKRWCLEPYFCAFVQNRYPKRYITVDQWDSVIDFALAFRYEVNLLQFEGQENSAWPMLMDEFVEDTMRLMHEDGEQGSAGALSQC